MLSAFDRRMCPLLYKQVENNGDGPVDAALSVADSLSTKVVGEAVQVLASDKPFGRDL
jgi:hypothetical protein